MTLNEYLNQADPQLEIKVFLTEDDYTVVDTVTIEGTTYSTIKIPAIAERYGIEVEYIRVNDDKRLHMSDPRTGLIKGISVFYLS